MSIPCSCLVLFLLCLSLHACNARRDLGSVDRYKKSQPKPHFFSIKGRHEDHFNNAGVANDISTPMEMLGDTTVLSTDDNKARVSLKYEVGTEGGEGKGFSGDAKYRLTKKSRRQGLVSWRVPNKKRGEKQPGFNLDYAPPKTHPPSHN